jgi:hypothetical protein
LAQAIGRRRLPTEHEDKDKDEDEDEDEAYLAMLHHVGGHLSGECDCPEGDSGSFCEHSVALGLCHLVGGDAVLRPAKEGTEMGRKSRMKRRRRVAHAQRHKAIDRMIAERRSDARARALSEVSATDSGPHALLPDRLHVRRLEVRDRSAANAASFWVSEELLGELFADAERRPLPESHLDVLHDLDAIVAWEALLEAQDADPDAVPDERLCKVVADCAAVERGGRFDPLLGGTWHASQELVDRLNATSAPEGTAEHYAAELADTEQRLVSRVGEQARSLLRYVAAETTRHYRYPEGSWPTVADLPDGFRDWEGAVGTWAAYEGVGIPDAIALAVRMAPVLREIAHARSAPIAS